MQIKKKEYEEGGIKSSSVMLNTIPEIDLGLEEKLKTLEKTEKAKRDFLISKKQISGKSDLDLPLEDPSNRFHEPKDLGLTPGQIMQDLFGFRRVAKSQKLHTIGTDGFDPTADAKDRY